MLAISQTMMMLRYAQAYTNANEPCIRWAHENWWLVSHNTILAVTYPVRSTETGWKTSL